MPRCYCQLDLDERRSIFRLLSAKVPVAVIARQLGRHRSTIHREISRNHFREQREYAGYFPLVAHDLACQRRRRLRKLVASEALRGFVVDKLEACWSPQQIAGRLKLDGPAAGTLCHETIYRFVYGPEGREASLYRLLPKSRRQRRPRYGRKPRASFVPPERAISHRPSDASSRKVFGHWEGDLLIFRKEHGRANLTSMIERQTRFTVLLRNPSRRSSALVGQIGQALNELPRGACRTITFDRGSEFAAYPVLHDQIGAEAYFCDPHSPWQKGAVENANGRIRRFLPSERNLAELTADDLAGIVTMLNTTPRRCLGYRTPQEVFDERVAAFATARLC
jgi:transposase, IS30 family